MPDESMLVASNASDGFTIKFARETPDELLWRRFGRAAFELDGVRFVQVTPTLFVLYEDLGVVEAALAIQNARAAS